MNENKTITNADRIKAMSTDELAAFLVNNTMRGGSLLAMADSYICRKCEGEHNGKCPINLDEDPCLYELDDIQTLKYWLDGAAE